MRWALAYVVSCSCAAVASCAAIAGVDDLRIDRRDTGSATVPDPPPLPDDPDPIEPSPGGGGGEDAGADAATCPLPDGETFAVAPRPPWVVRGAAAFASPGLRLTPNTAYQAGALWWDERLTFDRFDVSFAVRIVTTGAGTAAGDGLAFAWVAGNAAPTLPDAGGSGLAVQGFSGWAIVVDTYMNVADGPVPFIAVRRTDDMVDLATTGAIAALGDGNAHTLRARLADGAVTVELDGAEVLAATAIPGYAPYAGYFGFGAATGAAVSEHTLTLVSARVGAAGACAAR